LSFSHASAFSLLGINKAVHRLFLILDAGDQRQLRAATFEIMGGVLGLEVGIPLQIVRQETDADLERDQLAEEGEMGFFGLVEEAASRRQTAPDQRLENRHLDMQLREVGLIFSCRTGGCRS
jgi:hypothetical protein